MPTCPICHADIDYLSYNATVSESGTATLYAECDLHFHEKHSETEDTTFSCPKCYTLLFDNQDHAVAFLLGKDDFVTLSPDKTTQDLLQAIQEFTVRS